ncbi:MAG: hypothetical protein QOF25_1658 [Mycobacterium sp.]|jgi:hypothetical protein|nr:hypothetical protein [Mycobacterium sp.]
MIAAYPPAQTRVVHRVGCGYGGCGWTVLGYVLSRGPGLPNYTDDIRNWAEPLGVASLAVETALLALSVAALISVRRARQATTPVPDHRTWPSTQNAELPQV